MRILAVDEDGNEININHFFESTQEFCNNRTLMEQTSRMLKVIMRHPKDVGYIATKMGKGYCLTVTGEKDTYSIFFEITEDELILLAIY